MWRVIAYLICTYSVMAAISLALINGCEFCKNALTKRLFRMTVVVLVAIGTSVGLAVAGMAFLPRTMLTIPGMVILFSFIFCSSYAAPSVILPMCFLFIFGSIWSFRAMKNRNTEKAKRVRLFAVLALMLVPLLPYAVVESQTLLFGHQYHWLAGNKDFKVLSIGRNKVTVAVDDYGHTVYFLRKINGKWNSDYGVDNRGEYPGIFPPYPKFDG